MNQQQQREYFVSLAKKRSEQLKLEYEKIGKCCKNCGKKIPYEKRKLIFCNHSCAATHNNKTSPKRTKRQYSKTCLYCGQTTKKNRLYCNKNCQEAYKLKQWLEGRTNGSKKSGKFKGYVKQYLMVINNHSCQRCGWSEMNIYSNTIPLEVHHKDGNKFNNNLENLELLCPNCHSLTDSHCGLNVGRQLD